MRLSSIFVLLACFTVCGSASVRASSYTTLYQLNGQSEGGEPSGGVIQGANGTIYGQTAVGGAVPCKSKHGQPRYGCGTVFSLSPSGTFKVLATFQGTNGAYGQSGLTLVGSILIGATIDGGASDDGVIYAVRTDGSKFTLVHQFSGPDGLQPIGPLIPGKNGVFYGITSGGGSGYPAQNTGVLFSLTSAGKFTVLHTFSSADGINPTTLRGTPSGTLVGGTFYGGPTNPQYCPLGCGVVFSFNPTNRSYTVLQTFDGVNGIAPYVGSVGPDGTIYGNNDYLFSISPSNVYQVLGQGNTIIGYTPMSGPALAPDGSLYGIYTQNTGPQLGTLYSYTGGTLSLAYTFGDDGSKPTAEPTVTLAGAVIGTTNLGGICSSCGTIYQYTP